jgi:hypothetical protein
LKNLRQIAGGVAGAVTGFVAVLVILELTNFGNPADPITSGLLALFVFAPAGAIAGLVLGTKLAMRGRDNAGGLAGNSLRAFGALIALCAIAGTAYYAYAVSTATPWLNPNAAPPRFSSSRFAFRRDRHCRIPPARLRSNCRPTSTPCRASRD